MSPKGRLDKDRKENGKEYSVKFLKQRITNTVDPDETARYEPSHQDLQCLQNPFYRSAVLTGLMNSDYIFKSSLTPMKTKHDYFMAEHA